MVLNRDAVLQVLRIPSAASAAAAAAALAADSDGVGAVVVGGGDGTTTAASATHSGAGGGVTLHELSQAFFSKKWLLRGSGLDVNAVGSSDVSRSSSVNNLNEQGGLSGFTPKGGSKYSAMKQSIGGGSGSGSTLNDRGDSAFEGLSSRDRAGTAGGGGGGLGTFGSINNLLREREKEYSFASTASATTPITPSSSGAAATAAGVAVGYGHGLKRSSRSFIVQQPTATGGAFTTSSYLVGAGSGTGPGIYGPPPGASAGGGGGGAAGGGGGGGLSQISVVGPGTFQALLEEDLQALEYGMVHGSLEGWRIGRVDQFTRRVYLELLIPNIDSYTITNKHANANFNSYYRSEDLNSFNSRKGSAVNSLRYIELMIVFPVKYAGFWFPTFHVENKSGLAVRTFFFSSRFCFDLSIISAFQYIASFLFCYF
jgi:hypothetical protein